MRIRGHIWFCLGLLLAFFRPTFAADSFATERLRTIVSQLPSVSPSSLQQGNNYISYQNHTVVIRVNEWNEIEHAGYQIFADDFLKISYVPVCDFIERYFLELSMLSPASVEERLKQDDVILENGNPLEYVSMGRGAAVSLHSSDFSHYRVEWERDGRKLAMVFPMDCQLIFGCNAIELEKNYIRDVLRYRNQTEPPASPDVPSGYNKDFFIQSGGTYLSESVRHDLYYKKVRGEWKLLCDPKKPEWSAYNLMLSPVPVSGKESDWMLDLELDQYGYQSTPVQMPLSAWVSYSQKHDGTPYFIIKEMNSSVVKGVVFVPNERGGYSHMLSVEIPMKAIENGAGKVTGRLFVYIPLHNIDKKYFEIK